MLALWKGILRRQCGAAIDMLANATKACPDDLWDDRSEGPPFWHIVYHTLFFLDLYLSESEEAFRPREYHTANAQFLREMPFPPYKAETPENAFSREQLLGYLAFCRAQCRHVIDELTEEKAGQQSPFEWLDFTVGDLIVYNMRHVQHHAGLLHLILRRKTGSAPQWVGTASTEQDVPG